MSVVLTATLPVPELLRRYPELAGVRIPDTYRNDGVPVLLQDASAPVELGPDTVFPIEFVQELREHQPRRSLTAALSRHRWAARLAVGHHHGVRLAVRPFAITTIVITGVVRVGRHVLGRVVSGPDDGRLVDIVLGSRWPWDVLVG